MNELHGMKPIFKRGRDAEVATAASNRPEEIGVLRGVHGQKLTAGGDDIGREQTVDRHAVLAQQPADAAAKGCAGDAGGRNLAAWGGQVETRGFSADILPKGAGINAGNLLPWINANSGQARDVKGDTVFDQRVSGSAVTSRFDRKGQVVRLREIDR